MASGPSDPTAPSIAAELIAVVAAVTGGAPRVLTISDGTALPSGPFESTHRSLQASVRSWVERQTHHPLGYLEQLYTFADLDRTARDGRVVSVCYLGLAREAPGSIGWQSWYRYFPWEDRRTSEDAEMVIQPLIAWADSAPDAMARWERRLRVAINFGLETHVWNEEFVLQRYETLWEAGLVAEANGAGMTGQPMAHDHRRILATGIARLRGKIKYRPVVFELMPPTFTLGQLQQCVEALAGRRLHKQNFRRLVEQQDLVEDTGRMMSETGGRPARLMRFRRAVLAERSVSGTKLPLAR
jgi:hypothetical protein